MSYSVNSQIHAIPSTPPPSNQETFIQLTIPAPFPQAQTHEQEPTQANPLDYLGRAQWLRAAVLGANDGLVSIASLMIGVGAVTATSKAMLVSGLAGLVAGACSMAIGEFVSVYAQYDIEVVQVERQKMERAREASEEELARLPSPLKAAGASALAFALGGMLPLLAGTFIKAWWLRLVVVCAVTSLGLGGFGAAGAVVGGTQEVGKSMIRVLLGGWLGMLVTYGILKVFGVVFGLETLSSH